MKTGAEIMKSEIIEKYIVSNNKVMPVSEAMLPSEGSYRIIYEVVRIISGVPLFLEKHMVRLEASSRLMNYSIKNISNEIQSNIIMLIKANHSPDKNVKIIVYNLDNPIPDYMIYFIQSSYPTPEEYRMGVHGILLNEERGNPNAKVLNISFKERIASALADSNAYETFLVNKENEITEGSRSNVFFTKNGAVITAPKGNVLMGITRLCIFELCKNLGIEIEEKPIPVSALRNMDGVFITGTSPKILPVRSIDDMVFNSADNPIIKALIKAYDDVVAEYINQRKE